MAWCHSFCLFFIFYSIYTFIRSHSCNTCTFIRRHLLGPRSISSSLCKLSGKTLPVVPSRESNPGLPYSKPTRYHLNHAAPFLLASLQGKILTICRRRESTKKSRMSWTIAWMITATRNVFMERKTIDLYFQQKSLKCPSVRYRSLGFLWFFHHKASLGRHLWAEIKILFFLHLIQIRAILFLLAHAKHTLAWSALTIFLRMLRAR